MVPSSRNPIIILINGTFGAGKTFIAKSIYDRLVKYDPGRVADGPHLVHCVTTKAHGSGGSRLASCHSHELDGNNEPKVPHHHRGLNFSSHFPFTVLSANVSDLMFKLFLDALWQTHLAKKIIIAELGTGERGKLRFSQADFSTKRFLKVANQSKFWPRLKQFLYIVPVSAGWFSRIKRNKNRPRVADGIDRSWSLEQEVMEITREPDFHQWAKVISKDKLFPVNNSETINIQNSKTVDQYLNKKLGSLINALEKELT